MPKSVSKRCTKGKITPPPYRDYSEADLESIHDELLRTIDDQLVLNAHLLKISNFKDHILAKSPANIRYVDEETRLKDMPKAELNPAGFYVLDDFRSAVNEVKAYNQDKHEKSWTFELTSGLTEDALLEQMRGLHVNGYGMLEHLQRLMTPQTLGKRKAHPDQDAFTTLFKDGDEVDAEDVFSRLEFQYFSRMKVTLGIFECEPAVCKWLAQARNEEENSRQILKSLFKQNMLSSIFPGILMRQHREISDVPKTIQRDFNRNLSGIIPKTGILIGDVPKHYRPAKGQPLRLVSPA